MNIDIYELPNCLPDFELPKGFENVDKYIRHLTVKGLEAVQAYIPQFTDTKNGELDITYIIPELEEILKETYGVLIYQEQIMCIANKVAGYSFGQADNFRRKLVKNKTEECDKEKECFITGALNRGYSKEKAEEILELILNCANIAFNKSHSVAYTFLAYQTAYLKANFLKEYEEACNKID